MKNIPKVGFKKLKNSHLEFEIFPLESLYERAPKLNPPIDRPHRVMFHIILFITEGEASHFIDLKAHQMKAGDLVFISPGQVQMFDPKATIKGFMLLFTERFISANFVNSDLLSLGRLYNYHLGSPKIEPNVVGVQVFESLVTEINKEYGYVDNFAKNEILSLLLRILLLKAERIKKTLFPLEENPGIFAKFGAFQNVLEDRIAESRCAQYYANELGISYKHLNVLCKRVTGKTAKEFIDQCLILEAKRRLVVSDVSVKELAYQLNFEEPTNFVKYFKKHVGASPVKFRKLQLFS